MQHRLVYFILSLVPISNVFDLYFPITVLGFSFWNTFLVFTLLHILLLNPKFKRKEVLPILIFSSCYAVIASLRFYVFEEPFARIFSNWWYLHMSLIFILIIKQLKLSKSLFSNILYFHLLFLGLIGTLYFFDYPTIEIQSENTQLFFGDIKHRYEGIYTGANVYSCILFTLFMIFFVISERALIHWLILTPIVFFGLLASGSRLSFFLFIIFILYSVYNRNRFIFVLVLSYGVHLALNVLRVLQNDYRAFTVGLEDQAREEKMSLFFDIMCANIVEILTIGVNPVLLTNNSVTISDNSFTLIILNSGLIVFILWLLSIKLISPNFFKGMFNHRFAFVAIILIFSLNNAMLYLPWVLYVIFYFNLNTYPTNET